MVGIRKNVIGILLLQLCHTLHRFLPAVNHQG